MSTMTGPHHGNRHGRSERARIAVLHAADDLLAEKGFAGVTIEGIAARAGVAKQTIYRWWNSKTDILLDTFTQDAAKHLAPAEHDDPRAYLRRLAHFLTATDEGAVLRALIGQAQHDPELAATLRERLRAHQPDVPDELVGPIYYRVLVTGDPVDDAFIDRLVEHDQAGR